MIDIMIDNSIISNNDTCYLYYHTSRNRKVGVTLNDLILLNNYITTLLFTYLLRGLSR